MSSKKYEMSYKTTKCLTKNTKCLTKEYENANLIRIQSLALLTTNTIFQNTKTRKAKRERHT